MPIQTYQRIASLYYQHTIGPKIFEVAITYILIMESFQKSIEIAIEILLRLYKNLGSIVIHFKW